MGYTTPIRFLRLKEASNSYATNEKPSRRTRTTARRAAAPATRYARRTFVFFSNETIHSAHQKPCITPPISFVFSSIQSR